MNQATSPRGLASVAPVTAGALHERTKDMITETQGQVERHAEAMTAAVRAAAILFKLQLQLAAPESRTLTPHTAVYAADVLGRVSGMLADVSSEVTCETEMHRDSDDGCFLDRTDSRGGTNVEAN